LVTTDRQILRDFPEVAISLKTFVRDWSLLRECR